MSWWENDPLADAPASGGPKPLLDLRDPGKQQGLENDQTRTGIAVRGEQRDVNKTDFDQKGALYERYSKLPEVKTYRVAVQQLAQAIGTGDGPQADLALTYAFAKAMDPESVVRESEQGMVTGSQPWLESAAEKVKKQFGMDGAGLYTPETRKQIRAQIANAVAQRNKLYNQQRDYFTELARRNNFDPYEVVGDHDANPFAEKIRAWGREGQQDQPANSPALGGYPEGVDPKDIEFVERDAQGNITGYQPKDGGPFVVMFDSGNIRERDAKIKAAADAQDLREGQSGFGARGDSGLLLGLSDELQGVGSAIGSAFRGENPIEGYQFGRDVARERYDRAQQNTGLAGDIVEVGSSLALPVGGAGSLGRAALTGAGIGAAGGFGYGEGAEESIAGSLVGAGIGAAAGAGGYGLGSLLTPKTANPSASTMPTVDAARIAQAGAEEGVPVNRAMVAPELSNKVTAVESSLVGGPIVRGGMQQVSQGIEGRVGNLSKGTALDPVIAGERVQGAVKRADKEMKSEVDRLYDSYRKASGDPPVMPQTALSQVETELADLAKSPNTNAGEINYLTDLKSDLASGSMTVDTLLGLRRSMRGQIRERNLGLTQAEARVQRVLDAAGDDVAKALDPKSPAYAFLQRANKAHGERQVFKRQVVKELIGMDRDIPLDPDKAFKKLQQWSKPGADGSRLIATWKKFTPEEAADVAATIAEPLGRDKGGVFSPALFVSQVDQLSDRARVTAFGPEGKRSIDNLIELSNQFKRVQGAFNNSKSGVAINSSNAKQAALTVLGASGGGYAGGWTGAAVGASLAGMVMAKNLVSARALMSPNISKWLVGLSKKPNQPAALAHIARLENLAKAEPVIANEVLQLQSVLKDAFQQYPERLAAQEPGQGQGAAPQATQRTAGAPQ